MNISFKPIGKREREALKELGVRHIPDPNPAHGMGRGSVVTINGYIVVAFGYHDAVIYQDGSDAVSDLIRAHKRVSRALGMFSYDDWERVRRRGRPQRTVEDILRGAP